MNEKKGEVRDYDTWIIIMVSCETINRNGQSSYDNERNTFKEMNSTLPLSYLNYMLAEPSMTKILIGNINSVNRINKMGETPPPKKTPPPKTILPEQFQNLIEKKP